MANMQAKLSEAEAARVKAFLAETEGSVPDLKKLHAHLVSSQEELIQHMPYLDEAALALNPTAHTLGLIFILNCKGMAMPLSDPAAVGLFQTCETRRAERGVSGASARVRRGSERHPERQRRTVPDRGHRSADG